MRLVGVFNHLNVAVNPDKQRMAFLALAHNPRIGGEVVDLPSSASKLWAAGLVPARTGIAVTR